MTRHLTISVAALLALACNGPTFEAPTGPPDAPTDPGPTDPMLGDPPTMPTDPTGTPGDLDGDGYPDVPSTDGTLSPEWQDRLRLRELDYQAALRTASLRLRGTLPTLVEIRYLEGAGDARRAYEQLIDDMLETQLFTARVLDYFRDTFRMGGGAMDSAPRFAAQLVIEGRDFTEVLTASSGTCPTYDGETNTFTAADCDNGAPAHSGLLTHPAVMQQFYSNLAFRRIRWVQEVFACQPFPAEVVVGVDIGGAAPYTAPWPFESIAGADNGGRIDFHDTSSVVCANCHATMNHLAPLFARFDDAGMWQGDIQVRLPLDMAPVAVMADWLPEGEGTAWRYGVPAADLPALGRAMAADPQVHRCMVSRVWNWAMGHGDIVAQAEIVPDSISVPLAARFVASGHDLRATVRDVFTSDDFVRF